MEDVALYNAYYGQYHYRAAEAAAEAPSVSRKQHGFVCAFLAFGAACGMSTVAVGFFAHNPAIIWPVVAVGLVGVIVGLLLAHRKATGSWAWTSTPSRPAPSQRPGDTGQTAAATAGTTGVADRVAGGFQLPMYCADAMDVELGLIVKELELAAPYEGKVKSTPGAGVNGAAETGGGGSSGSSSSGGDGSAISDDGSDSGTTTGKPASKGSTAPPVRQAAAAAEYGAVMCGMPVARADGWIDVRPVLVLQPHPQSALLMPGWPTVAAATCCEADTGVFAPPLAPPPSSTRSAAADAAATDLVSAAVPATPDQKVAAAGLRPEGPRKQSDLLPYSESSLAHPGVSAEQQPSQQQQLPTKEQPREEAEATEQEQKTDKDEYKELQANG